MSQLLSMNNSDPPFGETYMALFDKAAYEESLVPKKYGAVADVTFEECDLPLIDLARLKKSPIESRACKSEISQASREWGFFQVVNHGVSRDILEEMKEEQLKVFRRPFEDKIKEKFLSFSSGSYRWGTPSATCLKQISWSEAFHVPLSDILGSGKCNSLSSTMEEFVTTVSDLAHQLAVILAEDLGFQTDYFKQNCLPSTCYLRMNRYLPCSLLCKSNVFGLIPHTDSDFLTILHQDEVGGLQLVRDGQWISVKPNPNALIVNIGDLFQAWSNDVYKSVEHRVVANPKAERFSTAYFLCPSYDTVIESCGQPPRLYRNFSFREYRQQVQEDVIKLGHKVGLPRFLSY